MVGDTLKMVEHIGKYPDLYSSMDYLFTGYTPSFYTFANKTYFCFTDCDSLFVYADGKLS